jgi:tetratricopeptide (TPR) repeat protein
MRKFRPLLATPIAACLLVSACQVADNLPAKETSTPDYVDTEQSEKEKSRWKITGNSRVDTNTAISALQVGKSVEARRLLMSATGQSRVDSRAISLLKQIDTSPSALFGEDYFEYTVNSGEFLSTISKRFLGDPLLFYALARYNGIENPSRINAGMNLRIPGERPVEDVAGADSDIGSELSGEPMVTEDLVENSQEEPVAEDLAWAESHREGPVADTLVEEALVQENEGLTDNSQTRIAQLQSLYESKDYQELLDAAEAFPTDENVKRWIEDSALSLSLTQERRGNYPAALSTINRGIELIGANDVLVDSLSLVTDKNEANLLIVKALKGGSSQQQYAALQRAVELHPSVSTENENFTALSEHLIEQFHKEAMLALRQQKLAEAIELWDQVLHLDSNNELAIVHKARAENLQKKLKDIN